MTTNEGSETYNVAGFEDEEATNQGMWPASRRQKSQANQVTPNPPEKKEVLLSS